MANSKAKQGRRLLVFGGIVLVMAGVITGVVLKRREAVITVQTELVVANGRIQPVLQVKISPEVSGEIIELPVKEGQDVKKGDLLLKIKPDYYTANLNQADAQYKSSVASKATSEA